MADVDASFETFCRRVYPRLVGSLSFQVGRVEVAEELAQDALTRAHERWSTLTAIDRPDAWVHRVARNLASSWWRRTYAERRANRRVGEGPAAVVGPDAADRLVVRDMVTALPSRQRSALVLRYYVGFSVAETAEVMGCAEGTVKSLTNKAIVRLRGQLDDDLGTVEVAHVRPA